MAHHLLSNWRSNLLVVRQGQGKHSRCSLTPFGRTSPHSMTRFDFANRAKRSLLPLSCAMLFSLGACGPVKDSAAPATLVQPDAPEPSETSAAADIPPPALAAGLPQNGETATPVPSRDADHSEATRNSAEKYIVFPPGSVRLDDRAITRLQGHAARLRKVPSQVVALVAHTASSGSRSYNLAVAEQRLHAVVKALRSLGVRGKQLRKLNADAKVLPKECQTEACRLEMHSIELRYEQ